MGILNAFFDVVAGVSILAGRSSLLDTRLTTVAGRNLTLRTTLGIGFFGVGFVNLWAASRRQKKIDKLAKGSETFAANWLETPDGIRYTKAKEDGTYPDWYFERYGLTDKKLTERTINDHLYKLMEDVRDGYLYGDGKEGFGEYCRNSKYDCWDEWDYYNASSRYLDEIGLEKPYLEVMKPHHKDLYDALMKTLQENEWEIYSHNLPAREWVWDGSRFTLADASAESFGIPNAAVMRTYKGRKGPAISAKSVKIGTRKRGNDGRMWQVRRAGKTQRWFRD